uniref:5-hydroxytryptamine receptor 4 n=1 Tax=Oryzias latipes TaxID=8090 RepID=A0A3P9L2I7_ORYLA
MLSKVVLGVILSLLILLTVGGNVLVCLAVCASRRLRCLTNCFIVSLAVTDLLLGLLVLPFSALILISDDWPLGPVFCNFYISMDVMLCTASILTLLAISVDRYLAVTMPLRYGSIVVPWRVGVAMMSVWIVSVALSFLPIQMGWNTVNGTVQNQGPWASERRCRFELNRPYVLTDSLLTFYLPLVAMCWTYLQILRIARVQAKRIINTRPTCVTSYDCRSNPPTSTTLLCSVTAVALREHKATVTLAAVIGAFVVCWLPYFILFTVLGLREHPDPAIVPAYPVVLWLGYANSALNPFLYGVLNRDFRAAYTHLLICHFHSYSGCRIKKSSPTTGAAREHLTEMILLCGQTPATCRAAITDQNVMHEGKNSRTATTAIHFANGTAVTDVTGNDRETALQCVFMLHFTYTNRKCCRVCPSGNMKNHNLE